MNRTVTTEENGDTTNNFTKQQQDSVGYAYEGSYSMYSAAPSTSLSSVNQPLPGQPPLPPMPPPPGALPPLPHVFGPVPSQVTSIQAWAHPPPPPWQWITPQATSLQQQSQRDMTNNTFHRDLALGTNYIRRDRFNHNRNNVYNQRNNFHCNKNRRPRRFKQPQGQFHPSAYFGQALTSGMSIDSQRTNITSAQNEALMNHMTATLPGHQMTPVTARVDSALPEAVYFDQNIKIVPDGSMKKTKQRKPMSQNYPSRPWNREDAESALQIENEYNQPIRAQSLIIKFPDPDLNKDIVREFHPGIQNIHFQSPSGPRYCFIQMAKNVNIDDAIKELEAIPFGVGHLKVERKSLREEDNIEDKTRIIPDDKTRMKPEEIDPYTLYVGNLPEFVNVNEVKSKFPTAARVDVGYAQKMRNTRYAFIRYTNVEESIAAYKQAHDLMWDTRSIIVRFRRQRGNTCLPGEPKNNFKKIKEEPESEAVKKERANNANNQKGKQDSRVPALTSIDAIEETTEKTTEPSPALTKTVSPSELPQNQQNSSRVGQVPSATETTPAQPSKDPIEETTIITDIKEEPQDYDDMEMSFLQMEEDDDDDDDDEDEDDDEDDEDRVREGNIVDMDSDDDEEDDDEDDADDEEEDMLDKNSLARKTQKVLKDTDPSDGLDQMFGELDNLITYV